MNGVEIRLALAASFNRHQFGPLQFPDEFGHARPAHAHVLRQTILARKTRIIVPGIAQKHGIRDLRADGQIRVFEDEIGHLRKATAEDWILRGQMQVMLLEDFPDLFHVW